MALSLQEVLEPLVLTEAYNQVASASGPNPMLDFYTAAARNTPGDRFDFIFRPAVKDAAPANFRGAPARVIQVAGLSDRNVSMFHAFNEVALSMDALMMLRNPENTDLQNKGRAEITRTMEDHATRHRIFRALVLSKTMLDGQVSIDEQGRVLETTAGAAFTANFGLPASHQGQLDPGTGPIVDISWANPSAKILDDLDQIREQAEVENSEPPTHVWAHNDLKRHLRNNTQLEGYFQRNPEASTGVLRGSVVENLGGLTWHFFSGSYTAADASNQFFLPKTKALITPDPTPTGWLRARNGSELIPRFTGVHQSPDEALADLIETFGDFAYVRLDDNPTKLTLRMGTNFVYALANPNAVWAPTVVF